MTMETRKHLSVVALAASAVCAMFLIVSAFAAAAHQTQQIRQIPSAWLEADPQAPR